MNVEPVAHVVGGRLAPEDDGWGAERAIIRLDERFGAAAIRAREAVAIFGDYDVDGAASAALLAGYLDDTGVARRIHIPDRITEGYGPNVEAIRGLEAFSHLEVVFLFHLVEQVATGERHPRGNQDWPSVGIFAQRAKDRPNRLGVSRCSLIRVDGRDLHVAGLDAIDGTPVLDLKPHMREFDARGEVRQPVWAAELMALYW